MSNTGAPGSGSGGSLSKGGSIRISTSNSNKTINSFRGTNDSRSTVLIEPTLATRTAAEHWTANHKNETLKKTQIIIKKLTQMAGFIPDFILREDVHGKIPYQKSTDAVVFMVDVSGFTALTEAYSLKGKGGTDQLTKTLMNYIRPLAEAILLCDADIEKYAGDAFLAFWRTNPYDYNEDVQRAIDCALYIQEHYGSLFCKEVDITIKVKIGIGAGIVHLCGIGNDSFQHYVCFGPGVEAASAAEKHCGSGEVVLHPSTWSYCIPSHYRTSIRDETFRVVTQINNFINPDKRGVPRKTSLKGGEQSYSHVRSVISEYIETKSEDFMRKFIIPPVLRKLDDDIPLEYLNESRMVCICFMLVETAEMSHEGIQFRENMIQIVNKCFVKIYTSVTRMQGALTKVIMFDKGLTYLVVFGLPGYVSEHLCSHALQFSHQARRNLMMIRGVNEVSIGVTTGSCYTGVLGHPRRQEYTVMGRKVNKAARLMVHYPGKVACDQDTAYHSKLPFTNFELQEYKELKGIANPGKIFEFINSETQEDNSVTSFVYPIVGRDLELRFFKDCLHKSEKELQEHNNANALITGSILSKEATVSKGMWMLVFEGENGIGKSRLLAACLAEAEHHNCPVFSVAMNLMMTGQTMFGISSLIMDAIGIGTYRTPMEREDYLRKRVREADLIAELCVINDVLHTKFPMNPKYANLDTNAIHSYAQHVLASLVKAIYPTDLVFFAVDDAHFLDLSSWEYLLAISKATHIFVIVTLRRSVAGTPKIPDTAASQIYHGKNVKVVRLNGLEISHCLTLACQMLEVHGIPADLEKILKAKSQGVPAWCEQVLQELLRTGVIQYADNPNKTQMMYIEKSSLLNKIEGSVKKKTEKGWAVDDDYFKESAADMKLDRLKQSSTAMQVLSSADVVATKRVLVVKSGTNLAHVKIQGTLHEILLDLYDELNSNEQIILKCASVMGRKFSKLMVTRILPFYETKANQYETGFRRLMEAKYIRCASGVHTKSKDVGAFPECFCKESAKDAVSRGSIATIGKKAKYKTCKYMEFAKDTLAEVVYDLMTQSQKKDFHLKSAKYLDSCNVKCRVCGGPNSAYAYGVVLKSTELGLMDGEEVLRAAGTRKNAERSETVGFSVMKKRRTSLSTQIAGMKRRFQNDGSRIAQIEFEILSLLQRLYSKNSCLCRKKKLDLNDELHLRDIDDRDYLTLKDEQNSAATVPQEVGGGETGRNSSISQDIDLRLCECAAIQAKVCIEKVKHYREAEKYGKCMTNLLEAAEAVINIGNGTQGLVHLEDAAALQKSLKEEKVQVADKDDVRLEEKEVDAQIEYLTGQAYFEMGSYHKSKECFLRALARHGLTLPLDDNKMLKESSLFKAKVQLWKARNLSCHSCSGKNSGAPSTAGPWKQKLRILKYLHSVFNQDKKLDMAFVISIWEVLTAEKYGDIMHDLIPAYCNMMATHTAMAHHRDAQHYENLSLKIIRHTFGTNETLDPAGLLTTAGLFHAITYSRLLRGEIDSASEAAYLGLRIAQTINDNSLMIRLLPSLIITLMMSLRISELIDALRKLWYISEEEDDWSAMGIYYVLCLELLLNTAYPLESFVSCENFVLSSDWDTDGTSFIDLEVLFSMEACMAVWYARYSRWDDANKWLNSAETHRPKLSTFLSVGGELHLLECKLIFVSHYLEYKRFQQFAKARNEVKELMQRITKLTKVAPVLKPRFLHLTAYYYKMRSRNLEAEKTLKQAEKLAKAMGDTLELQWILHNRTVWNDMAIPSIKFFWLEHTENHVLDWHTSGEIPWSNVMYSLPLK